ncbi:MAG: 3-deoxy-7-phosphoheptulonate synthase [Planctomycetes bacterium]|nr:3-deoxy-7-phosphoheptulonate synthase [Planctomycetota bacterium]
MIIVLKQGSTKEQADEILKRISDAGLKPLYLPGDEKIVLGAIGDERVLHQLGFESVPFVERVVPILKPYKLANREFRPERSRVKVGRGDAVATFGGDAVVLVAGPCAVESEEQLLAAARAVKAAGAHVLRGGAFKPRTSPYSFQGMGVDGLKLLAAARDATGLPVVTEVVDPKDIDSIATYCDMLQIGARNMQNFQLLREVGRSGVPVMLKRGMSAGLSDLLMSAEYILSEGNQRVVLCERGIRTFSTDARNTFDLSIIPLLREETHLPIIADPSHATGKRSLVPDMARAAVAAGADGVMVEVHPNPATALSDGPQALTPADYAALVPSLHAVAQAVGRKVAAHS